jgi:hypothetical protein
MDPEFDELRATIYLTHPISSISASWLSIRSSGRYYGQGGQRYRCAKRDKAFKDANEVDSSITKLDATNRKATIVIEHLLQAFRCRIRCNTGRCTLNGTRSFSSNCTGLTKRAALIRIRLSSGTKVRSDSSRHIIPGIETQNLRSLWSLE